MERKVGTSTAMFDLSRDDYLERSIMDSLHTGETADLENLLQWGKMDFNSTLQV